MIEEVEFPNSKGMWYCSISFLSIANGGIDLPFVLTT